MGAQAQAEDASSTRRVKDSRRQKRPIRPGVNSCRNEIVAMRMFEADSTASARLVKIAFLKLYNRKRVRLAIDLMTEGGRAFAANAAEDAPSEAYTEIVLQNRSTQTKIAPKDLARRRAKNTLLVAR